MLFISIACEGDCANSACRDEILQLAAEYLCPNEPESVMDDISADIDDSGITWFVWIGEKRRDIFFEYVPRTNPEELFTPTNDAALAYKNSLPTSCIAQSRMPDD
jgi:hypothetical protein